MNWVAYISLTYLCACIATIGFQIALIIGAPWGRLTQGGQNEGPLPLTGRIVAFISIFVLAAMAMAVLSAAGLWPNWHNWTGLVAVAIQALSCLLNWITPSALERRLWGPATSVMLALATVTVFAGW